MARNSEKAQSMLFRFREQQQAELGIIDSSMRRPKRITEVESIPACEKWRSQVVKEISRKVTKIQDPSLSDHQIRDLNDEINKLMREKHIWELQLRNLGGPNYMRFGSRIYDSEGREVAGNRGYKYFGRARELPGVKELFEALEVPKEEVGRKKVRSVEGVGSGYYGYGDEDDGDLLKWEEEREEEARKTIEEQEGGEPERGWERIQRFDVPSQKEVEGFLLEKRKQRLLDRIG
ncbi:NineTeen Complex (NTC) component [Saitoella coloradoensis]